MSPLAAFIRANLPLAPVRFVPEVRLHKAGPASRLRRLAEADATFGSPYWAHYWGGGLALARFLLDRSGLVAGRRVFDLGTGSGLVAIAAALAGAADVIAADIDAYAVAAAGVNAEANGVALTLCHDDVTAGDAPAAELVTVGDLFYDRDTAARVLGFLGRCLDRGAEVLIGDPWRTYLPQERLHELARFAVSELSGAADPAARPSGVFRLIR